MARASRQGTKRSCHRKSKVRQLYGMVGNLRPYGRAAWVLDRAGLRACWLTPGGALSPGKVPLANGWWNGGASKFGDRQVIYYRQKSRSEPGWAIKSPLITCRFAASSALRSGRRGSAGGCRCHLQASHDATARGVVLRNKGVRGRGVAVGQPAGRVVAPYCYTSKQHHYPSEPVERARG